MIKHHILLVLLLYFPGCSCFITLDTPLSLLDQENWCPGVQTSDVSSICTHIFPWDPSITNTIYTHTGNSYLPRSSDLHSGLFVSTQHLTQILKWPSDLTCDIPYTPPTSNSSHGRKGGHVPLPLIPAPHLPPPTYLQILLALFHTTSLSISLLSQPHLTAPSNSKSSLTR